MKASGREPRVTHAAPTPGSGMRIRADLVLLAEAALQFMEGEGGALALCDAELRLVAATAGARAIAEIDDAETSLPDEIRTPVLACMGSLVDGEAATLVVRRSGVAIPIAVRVRRLTGALASTVALTFEPAPEPPPSVRTALSALGLSVRERQLVDLLRRGQSNHQIAVTLRLTEGTVKIYLHHLFRKLAVESRMQLVARIEELVRRPRL